MVVGDLQPPEDHKGTTLVRVQNEVTTLLYIIIYNHDTGMLEWTNEKLKLGQSF